jgi:hypothetical protein
MRVPARQTAPMLIKLKATHLSTLPWTVYHQTASAAATWTMMTNTDALQAPTASSARVLMPVLWLQGPSASNSLWSQSDNARLGNVTLLFQARLQHWKTSPLYFVSFCANDDDYDRPQTNHLTLQYRRFLWVLLLSVTTFLDLCYMRKRNQGDAHSARFLSPSRIPTWLAPLENLLGRKLSGRSFLELTQLELSKTSRAMAKNSPACMALSKAPSSFNSDETARWTRVLLRERCFLFPSFYDGRIAFVSLLFFCGAFFWSVMMFFEREPAIEEKKDYTRWMTGRNDDDKPAFFWLWILKRFCFPCVGRRRQLMIDWWTWIDCPLLLARLGEIVWKRLVRRR